MAPPVLPRNNNRTPPPSDYTAKIAESGLAGLDEARRARRYGVQGVQTALDEGRRPVYARPTGQSDMYDKWLADTSPSYGSNDSYAFGRTADGAYAGFKTQGVLQSAIKGRAEALRGQDREVFGALDQMANENLDKVATDYKDKYGQNWMQAQGKRTGVLDAASANLDAFDAANGRSGPSTARTKSASAWDAWKVDPNTDAKAARGVAPVAYDANGMPTAPGVSVDDGTQMGEGLTGKVGNLRPAGSTLAPGMQRSSNESGVGYSTAGSQPLEAISTQREAFVNDTLNPWRDREANKWLEQQDFAQQGYNTPIQHYGLQAADEYGVDPNIARGWYTDASAIGDARDQRDLAMLDATGMTNSDFMSAANSMLSDQQRAQADQESAYTDQYSQAINDQVFNDTGGIIGADKLAQQVGIAPEEVAGITSSPAFNQYSDEIYQAIGTNDPDTVNSVMSQVLTDAAFREPSLYNILQIVYKDYIPTDFNLLDG